MKRMWLFTRPSLKTNVVHCFLNTVVGRLEGWFNIIMHLMFIRQSMHVVQQVLWLIDFLNSNCDSWENPLVPKIICCVYANNFITCPLYKGTSENAEILINFILWLTSESVLYDKPTQCFLHKSYWKNGEVRNGKLLTLRDGIMSSFSASRGLLSLAKDIKTLRWLCQKTGDCETCETGIKFCGMHIFWKTVKGG